MTTFKFYGSVDQEGFGAANDFAAMAQSDFYGTSRSGGGWADGDWEGDGLFAGDTENSASANRGTADIHPVSDTGQVLISIEDNGVDAVLADGTFTVFAPTDRAGPSESIDFLMPIEDVFLFDAPKGAGPANEDHAGWVQINVISQGLQRHSPSSSADDGNTFASVRDGEFVDEAKRFEVPFVDDFCF